MNSPIIDDSTGQSSTTSQMSTPSYSWDHTIDGTTYKLTNDKSLLDLSLFNKAFSGDDVYWTGPMSPEAISLMVSNSCVLGLYIMKPVRLEANHNIRQKSTCTPEQIGFGRIITDYSTVAYITDVWLSKDHQGQGLGRWMVKGMKEIMDAMPALRRAVLLTKVGGKGVEFYSRELGMRVADPAKDAFGFMQFTPEK